jgi:class 3 adenylate cyclase
MVPFKLSSSRPHVHGPGGGNNDSERVATTPDENTQRRPARRLAAILAADVAGFSRLMGIDERGTFELVVEGLRKAGIPA